jgi:NAD(P)-dependent dehydrogenase (short-subunit alcohol dehydrogenase family)
MNINVTGMFLVLQRVAKQMSVQNDANNKNLKESDGDGGGSASTVSHPFTIVNTASVAALRGTPAMVAYSSSKAAILAMTVSCAKVCITISALSLTR